MHGLLPTDPSAWIAAGIITFYVLLYVWYSDVEADPDNYDGDAGYVDRHPFLDDPSGKWTEDDHD